MNIYLFKREDAEVEHLEFSGFVVRSLSMQTAIELVVENYNLERAHDPEETYLYDFNITLLASGVVGEPQVIMAELNS